MIPKRKLVFKTRFLLYKITQSDEHHRIFSCSRLSPALLVLSFEQLDNKCILCTLSVCSPFLSRPLLWISCLLMQDLEQHNFMMCTILLLITVFICSAVNKLSVKVNCYDSASLMLCASAKLVFSVVLFVLAMLLWWHPWQYVWLMCWSAWILQC